MYIPRDITQQLAQSSAQIQVLLGPRQCGKSTLFAAISQNQKSPIKEITFDDLALRQLANQDPALFLQSILLQFCQKKKSTACTF